MPVWSLIALLGAGFGFVGLRAVLHRRQQDAAASAAGLRATHDLSHVSGALQKTALWTLSDGGFERRVVHGTVSRPHADVDVTAFDMETLRERRGEWAYLPVERPFRIGGVVSVVVCETDRSLRHVLLKRCVSTRLRQRSREITEQRPPSRRSDRDPIRSGQTDPCWSSAAG
ncbi:MAG: hypothetical protein SFX73_33505 [Kofleriaceae bacterium]|nr:hypothetical protein [Kofleriaceae bacterium]